MDAQGIDYQAINVNAWGTRPSVRSRAISSRCRTRRSPSGAAGIRIGSSAWRRRVAASRSRRRAARPRRRQAGTAWRRDRRQRRRPGAVGPALRSLLGEGRTARRAALHAPAAGAGDDPEPAIPGAGGLENTIGNPLETTTFLSHLIFEGTLDRFPGLRICGAHGGGYLASYLGRSDALCGRGGRLGADCKALSKKPSEYFRRQLLVDTWCSATARCGI